MTPFIETWPLHRRPGHHAAFVWINGEIYAAYFGATLMAVIERAQKFVARVKSGELAL